jgi:uncharacterized protein
MTRTTLIRTVLILVLACGLVAVAVVSRVMLLDSGVRAVKEGHGPAAERSFKLLAHVGDSEAQYLLGRLYAYGWGGISSDEERALYWFRRAARGVTDEADPAAPAAFWVAKSYSEGLNGVRADAEKSRRWLEISARGGSREAAKLLPPKG